MSLPESLHARVKQQMTAYCERKLRSDIHKRFRLAHEIDGLTVTLFHECRGSERTEQWIQLAIARFEFDPRSAMWSLYCRGGNAQWFPYRHAESVRDLGALLHAIDNDNTGLFRA